MCGGVERRYECVGVGYGWGLYIVVGEGMGGLFTCADGGGREALIGGGREALVGGGGGGGGSRGRRVGDSRRRSGRAT